LPKFRRWSRGISLTVLKLAGRLRWKMKEQYVRIKKSELQLILAQISEMREKLHELKR
jgi:hypothetical protein